MPTNPAAISFLHFFIVISSSRVRKVKNLLSVRIKDVSENKEIAKRGGNIARGAKENLEQELGRSVISNTNAIKYRYLDENLLENKVSDQNE